MNYCVIVRVWLPRNRQGSYCTAHDKIVGNGARVGHVSLEMRHNREVVYARYVLSCSIAFSLSDLIL